jgi:hypothetical protein
LAIILICPLIRHFLLVTYSKFQTPIELKFCPHSDRHRHPSPSLNLAICTPTRTPAHTPPSMRQRQRRQRQRAPPPHPPPCDRDAPAPAATVHRFFFFSLFFTSDDDIPSATPLHANAPSCPLPNAMLPPFPCEWPLAQRCDDAPPPAAMVCLLFSFFFGFGLFYLFFQPSLSTPHFPVPGHTDRPFQATRLRHSLNAATTHLLPQRWYATLFFDQSFLGPFAQRCDDAPPPAAMVRLFFCFPIGLFRLSFQPSLSTPPFPVPRHADRPCHNRDTMAAAATATRWPRRRP